jgi:hypothetical protein
VKLSGGTALWKAKRLVGKQHGTDEITRGAVVERKSDEEVCERREPFNDIEGRD